MSFSVGVDRDLFSDGGSVNGTVGGAPVAAAESSGISTIIIVVIVILVRIE